MSSPIHSTLAQSIYDYFEHLGQTCSSLEDITWVLNRWSVNDKTQRNLLDSDLRHIEKIINTVSTGKRKHYKRALKDILFYLQENCHWSVPEDTQNANRDIDHEWFESIAHESQQAKQAFTYYLHQKEKFFTTREKLSPAFMALMIGFEVAPLSIRHICQILNDATSITSEKTQPRLRVHHIKSGNNESTNNHTHYHLSLASYRLLSDYYAQSPAALNEQDLCQLLTEWLAYYQLSKATAAQWSRRFQVSWYLRYHLPPLFIKDLAIPERHVSLSGSSCLSQLGRSDIYAIDWDLSWFEHLPNSSRKTRWPHNDLIKAHANSKPKPAPPPWDATDLLPNLLYLYTDQLLTVGGAKKSTLALSSILKYTGFEKILEAYPLSYADAINEEAVNHWAKTVFDSINNGSSQLYFVYFLRFLSFQEQTENIDLSLFTLPTLPLSVSPARIDLTQLNTLIHTLISTNSSHPFRSLFAVMATLLGFFGMLRRGEVLRLRCHDVQFEPKTGLLLLKVMNTAEGKTKNGQSRTVYTTIPEYYRNLFRVIFIIQKEKSPDDPFLGFNGEAYHSRQLYYLLPVSRALKMHFGTHMKFHHLRHSGVHLFFIQILHFVARTPEQYRGGNALELELMSDKTISTRFDYWLEGRNVDEINSGIFIDEMCAQIGHSYYTTTRWSYLHDIDWLLPIISPTHQAYSTKEYTHAELRYLMGLSPKSNDLSRRLNQLSPLYAKRMLNEKRTQSITLMESDLRTATLGKPSAQEVAQTFDHYKDWQRSIHTSTDTLLGFLFKTMMINQCLDLAALSLIWSLGCQHDISPVGKKQHTGFRNLPPVTMSSDGQYLQMTLACNSKNARAFTCAFRHKDWRWLDIQFELVVNRKLKPARQIELLKNHFVHGNEVIRILRRPYGQSSLTILFRPKCPISKPALIFTQQFIALLQSKEVTAL